MRIKPCSRFKKQIAGKIHTKTRFHRTHTYTGTMQASGGLHDIRETLFTARADGVWGRGVKRALSKYLGGLGKSGIEKGKVRKYVSVCVCACVHVCFSQSCKTKADLAFWSGMCEQWPLGLGGGDHPRC